MLHVHVHFIAVADWQTPLPSPWLQKNNKTTKHNGLITVFIVKPPNQLQMTRCVGADRVSNCCHTFVRVKQCFRSKLQAVWFWRTGFITWRGCAPLFSTVTRLFSWRKPRRSAGMLPPIEVTCTMMLPDIFVQGKKSCAKSWDVLKNVLTMGKCLWVRSHSS